VEEDVRTGNHAMYLAVVPASGDVVHQIIHPQTMKPELLTQTLNTNS